VVTRKLRPGTKVLQWFSVDSLLMSLQVKKPVLASSSQIASVPMSTTSTAHFQPVRPKAATPVSPGPSPDPPDEDEDEEGGFIPNIETIR
jgi:hypothetical protein